MFTPIRREVYSGINEMGSGPSTPLSFSRELRQVLQERNLLTAKSRKKVCAMLNGSTTSSLSTPNPDIDKRKSFRLQAIEEIINSEKTYLKQLEILMQYFVCPLKERAIISDASHTALFGQIEMIHNLNGEFLSELVGNMENVAHAFLKMAPFFKLYSVYAFDYRTAMLILQDLTSKNPVFRKFLQQTESRPEVQRKLNSLMIVPIQRVPRYKLLLEQVLLYTSPADADFKFLKESVKQIENTVTHINACVEDQEVTQMLINLQNSLVNRTPNIVKPSRKVIKEGILQKVTHNGTEIKRYCVLMSDIFMYCKVLKERAPNTVVDNSLECCCIFPLKKCKVYELFPGNFKITCQGDGIILGTKDLQLGRFWVGFIRDAIELHIQCRQTLRKESSKRKPLRKKDIKNFDTDFVLSPNKKKCDYETVFRNNNRSSDSEGENADSSIYTGCFPRKKGRSAVKTQSKDFTNKDIARQFKGLKRPAPPPPFPVPPVAMQRTVLRKLEDESINNSNTTTTSTSNRISQLYKRISSDKMRTARGILKRTTTTAATVDPTSGYSISRYSDTKSYFRATNVDNTIPTAVKREDLFVDVDLGNGNFRDVLYPLRLSGGSNSSAGTSGWSHPGRSVVEKEIVDAVNTPPQKKRVKFEESQNISCNVNAKTQPFTFSKQITTKQTMRERVYEFFTNLF